jgi:hypothetical protein
LAAASPGLLGELVLLDRLRLDLGGVPIQTLNLRGLEAGFHHRPVRDDVAVPLLEVADFVLRPAEKRSNFRSCDQISSDSFLL